MRKTTILLLMLLVACTGPEDVAKAEIEQVLPPNTEMEDIEPARKEIPIDMEASSFEFEGFGPGKSHVGSFTEIEGVLFVVDGEIVGGSGVIDASSVDTGIDRLDEHLKTDDFFDVARCPEIKFETRDYSDGIMTGDLEFHCITKEVSFPAEVDENGVSAEFRLDLEPFEIKYANIIQEARIKFEFVK